MNTSVANVFLWVVRHERLTGLLIISFFLASTFFIFPPLMRRWSDSGGKSVLDLERSIEEARVRKERSENSRATYARIAAEERAKLSFILPAKDDIPGLLVQLSALAKENRLQIQEVSLGTAPSIRGGNEETASAFVKEIPLSLKVTGGDYEILKKFLESLERHMRVMDVLSFDVSPDLRSYAFVLQTYYLTTP